MRSQQELEHILDQYDSDHAAQGGLAGAARKLFKKAGRKSLAAFEIVDRLFPNLPDEDRMGLSDILDRDLVGGGRGWLRSLVTDRYIRLVNRDAKTFVAALAGMTPKKRAAAWRKLIPEECETAWAMLTPEQRKVDGDALAIAWIDEAGDPESKRIRKEHVNATKRLAAEGLVVDAGRRDGQVMSVAVECLQPEDIERLLLDEPVKQRALGANAFGRGRPIADNPHPADTPAHQSWRGGFCAARDLARGLDGLSKGH
jgi:hypothetical protein